MTSNENRILLTGGAGYIGSELVSTLIEHGYSVVVLDAMWFGGESLLPFVRSDRFRLIKGDITMPQTLEEVFRGVGAVVHLAALVGFPACDRAGREKTWLVNVKGTQLVFDAAARAQVGRLVFASSYSNYGRAEGDAVVTEDSLLLPQSLYAESKIAAEQFLLGQATSNGPCPICLRLATVFGLSPRTRFDLMVNQFVLEAFTNRRLTLFQQDFKRSFVHVRDVARAIECVLTAPIELVKGQVFNVGSEKLNTTKSYLVDLLRQRWPEIKIDRRELDFDGDMRSIHVSFEKARQRLGFEAQISLENGIEELCWALENKIIQEPHSDRYRNHPPIVV